MLILRNFDEIIWNGKFSTKTFFDFLLCKRLKNGTDYEKKWFWQLGDNTENLSTWQPLDTFQQQISSYMFDAEHMSCNNLFDESNNSDNHYEQLLAKKKKLKRKKKYFDAVMHMQEINKMNWAQ